ncbi:MAG: ThiF family adenylyltransferase [Rubrobacteraceae bacterium]
MHTSHLLRDGSRIVANVFGELPPKGVPSILLIDGDRVEAKNTLRQDFMPSDAGRPKATVLAERYSAAYGLDVAAYPEYLTPKTPLYELIPEGSIVVGCVGNAPTRRLLHEKLSHHYTDVVYIDSGNGGVELPNHGGALTYEELVRVREDGWSGQVACGVMRHGRKVVPFPADVMPDLIEAAEGDLLPTEVPCGQVMKSLPKRQMTNLLAATTIMQYLTTLIADGTILHHLSFFDARRGYARSEPVLDVLDELAL